MYRIRIIFMSAFLFLLVGANMNVRASVHSDELLLDSNDKDQSENQSQEHETDETISQIDFFGAFSLVNIQLQWRDLHSGLNDEFSESESLNSKNEQAIVEVKTLTLDDEKQIIPTSGLFNTGFTVLPLSIFRSINGKNHYQCDQNVQFTSTIAYILNCGTYPKSC